MKTLQIFILATFSGHSLAMTVNWTMRGTNPLKNDNSSQVCAYENVLSERAAKKETNPPIPTIKFEKSDSLARSDHESCQTIMANLTNLDQPSVRDQIASIFRQFPCPDANVAIKSFQIKNDAIKTVYPTARSNRTMNLVLVEGCLKQRLDECVIPMSKDANFIMTYEDLKNGLARCRDAMNAAVQKGAELAAWKDQNDPNRKATDPIEHIKDKKNLENK
jgi:hypothetical protein